MPYERKTCVCVCVCVCCRVGTEVRLKIAFSPTVWLIDSLSKFCHCPQGA